METEQGRATFDEKLAPATFVEDVQWAARAIASQPSIALVSIAIWCLPSALTRHAHAGWAWLSSIVLLLGWAGWAGAERLFFLARREGRRMTVGALFAEIPMFVGRFLAAGLLAGVAMLPLFIAGALIVAFVAPMESSRAHLMAFRIEIAVIVVAYDLALTFVPSALVYTTRSARQAFRIGFRMIRQTWPRSGLYVLCPPLALNMLQVIYPTQLAGVRLATTAALALLALVAKGATAAFYLREQTPAPIEGPPPIAAQSP